MICRDSRRHDRSHSSPNKAAKKEEACAKQEDSKSIEKDTQSCDTDLIDTSTLNETTKSYVKNDVSDN